MAAAGIRIAFITPLADVIHPFLAFNRVLGESLAELAANVARHGAAQP